MSLIWVQGQTLAQYGAERIVEDVKGKFLGIVAYGSESDLLELSSLCYEEGLEIWHWVGAMYFDSEALPEWDYNYYHPDKIEAGKLIYVGDLLDDSQWQSVKNHIVEKCTSFINRFPVEFEGIFVDYCRSYQEYEMWADGVHRPRTDIQPEHVTEVFRAIRNAFGGRIRASVIPAKPSNETDVPLNRVYLQDWPYWIEQGWLESAHQMVYVMPDEILQYRVPESVLEKTNTIIAPYLSGKTDMTAEDIELAMYNVYSLGMGEPDAFEYGDMVENGKLELWPDWSGIVVIDDLIKLEEGLRAASSGILSLADDVEAIRLRAEELGLLAEELLYSLGDEF